MKELYSFEVNQKRSVEKTEEQKDGKKIVETVEEMVPIKIVLKSPSRSERKSLETFHHSAFSDALKKGIVTRAMIKKAYDQNGGIFTEDEQKEKLNLLKEYKSLQASIELQETLSEGAKSKKAKEEHDKKSQELFKRFIDVHQALEAFRSAEEEVYENSAENLARDKTIEWLISFLTMVEENGEAKPIFSGDSIDERNDSYEALLEEDSAFYTEVFEKSSTVFSMWYIGRAATKEEFDEIFEILYKAE